MEENNEFALEPFIEKVIPMLSILLTDTSDSEWPFQSQTSGMPLNTKQNTQWVFDNIFIWRNNTFTISVSYQTNIYLIFVTLNSIHSYLCILSISDKFQLADLLTGSSTPNPAQWEEFLTHHRIRYRRRNTFFIDSPFDNISAFLHFHGLSGFQFEIVIEILSFTVRWETARSIKT